MTRILRVLLAISGNSCLSSIFRTWCRLFQKMGTPGLGGGVLDGNDCSTYDIISVAASGIACLCSYCSRACDPRHFCRRLV
jgi:hypothetical protein